MKKLYKNLLLCSIFLSVFACQSEYPIKGVEVKVYNPETGQTSIEINGKEAANYSGKVGRIFLKDGTHKVNITLENGTKNSFDVEIGKDIFEKIQDSYGDIMVLNANPKNSFVEIDCMALYNDNREFKIVAKFINEKLFTISDVATSNFKFETQKLPDNLMGYGGLPSVRKLLYVPNDIIAKSDDEILKYCIETGNLDY